MLELNHAAENLFGTDAAVASRQALTAFCQIHSTGAPTPKSAEEWFHLLCRQRPLQVMRKDGRVVPAEVEGSRIDDDGRAAYQFFFREVTERSQLEQQLQQAQKLSGLGQMISGVAHELQNAIAGIKSLLDMIVAHREVTPQTWTYLEMASHESNRVVRLVRNFLSLIREHSERRGMIDLNELIRDVIQLRKFDMAMANVEQIVELDANLSRTFADPDQMKQVVLNLVNNALQALQESSMPRRLKFRTEQQQNLLRISIEDSGPGVPEYLESKIFEPYFTTKPIGVGTGLGLSISHSIICEHQGRIFYERSEMGGAAFHIELPVLRQTREEFGQPSEENKLPAMAGKA
ncbi:MAG: ATP-binding protein [Verrucomicrobiota bacterium]